MHPPGPAAVADEVSAEAPYGERLGAGHVSRPRHLEPALRRLFATVLIAVFVVHVGSILQRGLRGERGLFWGPNSLVPQPRDVSDLYHHVRWFLRLGPKPAFDRYTYWEKFDYWAVFWGMVIIGGSGLMLWFPEFFARFLPGWIFNVAMYFRVLEEIAAAVKEGAVSFMKRQYGTIALVAGSSFGQWFCGRGLPHRQLCPIASLGSRNVEDGTDPGHVAAGNSEPFCDLGHGLRPHQLV